jgi:peroxiredoxin
MKPLFVFVFALSYSFLLIAQEKEGDVGRLAPNFILENLEGDYIELNEEIGDGPVLLSFWATWCKPCIEELVELKKIYNDYKEKGFKLLAISTDNERTVAKVKPYVKSKNYNFPILYDTNSEVARIYYARAVPFTVLIDKDGSIVYSHMGYMRGDELVVRNKVHDLLER